MSRSSRITLDIEDPQLELMVLEELTKQVRQEAHFSELLQIEAAADNARHDHRSLDGVGGRVLEITPLAYIHFRAIEQLDFSNPRDIRWLTNRYPEMKVKARGTKVQSGHGGHTIDARSNRAEGRGTRGAGEASLAPRLSPLSSVPTVQTSGPRGPVRSTTHFAN